MAPPKIDRGNSWCLKSGAISSAWALGINLSSMLRVTSTDRVFILAGAGVSAESGIPTFRGVGGLWGCRESASFLILSRSS